MSLRCEELQVKDRQDCGWPSSNLVFKNIFCAEFMEKSKRPPDETNTGGPVLCNAAQYGIIPYDFHCNRPDGASHNCLYTRVDRMLEFIEESMEEYRLSNSAVHLTNCHSLIYATYLFTLPAVIRNVLL
ncbi:unnamed protein product, partial [Callosobruchus maculatus]